MFAGSYYWLYADEESSKVLCQFDPLGQGHACYPDGRLRLTSTKQGGKLMDESGAIEKSWTDHTPLENGSISFSINNAASLTFVTRYNIVLTVTLGGATHEFQAGEQLVHSTDNYIAKALGRHTLGPEKGKFIVDLSTVPQKTASVDVGLSKKTKVTPDDLQIGDLHSILRDTEDMKARVERMRAHPWVERSLLPSRMEGMKPVDFAKSMDDERWRTFLARTPSQQLESLPVSSVLKNASGRYRLGNGRKSSRRKLKVIQPTRFEEAVKDSSVGDALVVVCCLASWLPLSNKAERWLEALNGELSTSQEDGFVLLKYDMSSSRALKEKYNIHTLPCYCMFYRGDLAFISSALNGFGSSAHAMREQVKRTLSDSRAGKLLDPNFRFPDTDNKSMESMSELISALRTPAQLSVT